MHKQNGKLRKYAPFLNFFCIKHKRLSHHQCGYKQVLHRCLSVRQCQAVLIQILKRLQMKILPRLLPQVQYLKQNLRTILRTISTKEV